MQKVTIGKGIKEENAKLVGMINNVFASDDDSEFNFYKSLPKLYKEKYNPAIHNIVVREEGEIKGCVGLYYNNLTVNSMQLRCAGIGNVAVTPECRGKGYMGKCMNLALDEMIKNKTDLCFLSGQRQRYAYYSFEKGGQACNFFISMKNMQHAFGGAAKTDFKIRVLLPDDIKLLDSIYKLYISRMFRFDRPRNALYDILCSWSQKVYVLLRNEEFKGYFISTDEKSTVSELALVSDDDIKDVLLAMLESSKHSSFNISLPLFQKKLVLFLSDVAESFYLSSDECLSVFNFRHTIEVLLCFKASYTHLCDIDYTVLIHGKAGDENIHISIKNNDVKVFYTQSKPHFELAHLTALRLLFGISPLKIDIPADLSSVLPLPFYVAGADNV
ncbi:MAG: GNAT family N-acetyltransferase [Acutalibacteraceae bacterium]